MGKQILTLDNLYQFFVEQNKTVNFSSKESGQPIVVTTNGFFEAEEADMPGMLKLELKVCHTETNRNGSHISDANMEKAMPTLKYRPILAYIHELEDGVKDFYAHNMEIVEDENGEAEIHYIEKQVGCFTADDPWLKYDEDNDKTYVHAYAVIPEGYTEAADIIRRKNGTKVSCELVINELAYNAKEKYLDLTDFYFGGCTLLGRDENGREIGEGMLGARADISDFCHEEPVFTFQDKMIEALEKLNTTLSNFNMNFGKKGDDKMGKFEELLAKYGVMAEDVTFEIEGLSDEELEAKFAEMFDDEGDGNGDEGTGEGDGDNGDGEGAGDEGTGDDGAGEGEGEGENTFESRKSYSTDDNGNVTITFEISHEDIRGALNSLISVYDEEDNDWYWVTNVYNDYFVFENWFGDKLFRQSYTVDGDNVALSGDRQEMFKMILTESEKLAIEKMREDYSALVEFKENTEANQLQAQKDTIFARDEFASIKETKSFKKLVENSKDYSIEECEQRAKDILEDFNSFAVNFSAQDEIKKPKVLGFGVNNVRSKSKKPYGNLFADKE